MNDELFPRHIYRTFRRKRKHRGADWAQGDPPTLQDVNRGEWCSRCRLRHPYNGGASSRLLTQYEKRGKVWVLLWLCPRSGDVVGEVYLGGKR